MRLGRTAAVVASLTLVAVSTAQAQTFTEDFSGAFPAWETGWFGVNTDASNYYCARPCSSRGNNPTGLWLGGVGGALSVAPIVVNFTPSFGNTLTSLSIDVAAFVPTNFNVYDRLGTQIFSQALSGGSFLANGNGPAYGPTITVSSTNGISRFEFDGGSSSGNTAVDNVSVNAVVTATPEPATLALLGSGLLGLGVAARRRRAT